MSITLFFILRQPQNFTALGPTAMDQQLLLQSQKVPQMQPKQLPLLPPEMSLSPVEPPYNYESKDEDSYNKASYSLESPNYKTAKKKKQNTKKKKSVKNKRKKEKSKKGAKGKKVKKGKKDDKGKKGKKKASKK